MNFVFLDRDGTLIRHIPYLCDPRRVEVLPSVRRGLSELVEADCLLFLHTNQSGVGRGYFSLDEAMSCNDAMLGQIGLGQDLFAGVCLAPETPEQETQYRKPSPKYALEVMARHGADKGSLCYIGDNISDLLTACNVGCAAVGVDTGGHDLRKLVREYDLEEFPVFDDFHSAARYVVEHFSREIGNG